MPSLSQEILDLEMQLKCIREDIIGDWKDETCLKDLMKTIQSTKKQLVDALGKSLHNLAKSKPKECTVEAVVTKFPDSMKIRGNFNWSRLPIQSCVWSCVANTSYHALKYVPLLAREGMKHNVGGEEKRGGLLTLDPLSLRNGKWNTLQLIMKKQFYRNTKEFDESVVSILEKLKKDGFLMKEDVGRYNLLWLCACKGCTSRLKYVLQLDPKSIDNYASNGKTFMQRLILTQGRDLDDLKAVWKVTLELYPEQAGYIFQKDADGQQAVVERAIQEFGEKETMTAIHEIISPAERFPILHHALVHAPKLQTLFMQWFPWAYNRRDHNNRSLIQAILAAGAKVVNEHATVFASMSDDQICEKDPVTTLYPFAAVASGENGDLEKTFYLLRRQPGVLDAWSTVVLRRPRRSSRQTVVLRRPRRSSRQTVVLRRPRRSSRQKKRKRSSSSLQL